MISRKLSWAAMSAALLLSSCSENTDVVVLPTKLPVIEAAEFDQLAEDSAKREIMELVYDYAFARDQGDAEGYAAVFAPHGKFHFQGQVFEGREAIAGRVREAVASSNDVSLHFIGASQIEFDDSTHASGQHYGMVFVQPVDAVYSGAPIHFTGEPILGIYKDQYIWSAAEGWKIADRAFTPIFVPH